jgi:hypothetical protein
MPEVQERSYRTRVKAGAGLRVRDGHGSLSDVQRNFTPPARRERQNNRLSQMRQLHRNLIESLPHLTFKSQYSMMHM